MVRRVKNMVNNASDDTSVNSKALLKEVKDVQKVSQMNEEVAEQSVDAPHNKSKANVVPDKCPICEMGIGFNEIKYWDTALLKKYMSVRGKIIARSKSGVCAKHQRELARAIKRARYMALLPYVDIGI